MRMAQRLEVGGAKEVYFKNRAISTIHEAESNF